jgi:hypothetical protein
MNPKENTMTRPFTLATGAGWTPSIKTGIAAGLAVWLAAAWALGVSGVLAVDAAQPFRPVLLSILVPVAVFLAAYGASERLRAFVLSWDLRVLTMLHHWRVLGFTFLMLTAHGVLPGLFAWPAGWGDVAIGVSAPLVVQALARNPDFARSRAFVTFYVLGMLDFVVAGATATLASGAFPALHAGSPTSAPMEIWPLSLFPAFFVPLFLILHLGALFQVRVLRKRYPQAA